MKSGVRWEVGKAIPADEVMKLMAPFFRKRQVQFRSERTATHEMIYYVGQYGDGLFEVQTIEQTIQSNFGIRPERIARADNGGEFQSWQDFFAQLGERFTRMLSHQSRGYDI